MTIHAGSAATSSASSSTSEVVAVLGPEAPAGPGPALAVTVVICVYTEQRWPQIIRAVGSVLAQDVPAAQVVVVVDHNPALLERARATFPELTSCRAPARAASRRPATPGWPRRPARSSPS
ncbi:hypothetical protein [Micromonospora sp. ATA51]|uniref:hypothetical protein n=1 Tax=Micromonospora sp. ATA51 TaxID=2806098 RepID=UPI001A613CC1|nr:hypothetical protein [Micromonospora sp. ATA51]MBM0227121.1 hypothetical protein [Micromonospora sp. ATA51]